MRTRHDPPAIPPSGPAAAPHAGGLAADPPGHAVNGHSQAAISVADLVFDYPGHRALHGLSFEVAKGSVTALVGPNGAGKTTLLSCLAALLRPVSGAVRVDGVDMLEQPRLGHRRIGYLKDFYGLYDSLTVRQSLWHAARAQAIPAQECPDVVARVAADLDLASLIEARAGEMSRGQRQRLAIARTMVHRPAVLLLDEPASGLDPEARHELAELMRRLSADGTTLLVSSHILAELEEYSTEMIIIRDGRLLEQRDLGEHAAGTWMRLLLVEVPTSVPEVITTYPGVTGARLDERGVVFALAGDDAQRHAFLKACLDAGLAVSGLAELGASLQDEYLRRVAAQAPERS